MIRFLYNFQKINYLIIQFLYYPNLMQYVKIGKIIYLFLSHVIASVSNFHL
jgi:hypothetical protein